MVQTPDPSTDPSSPTPTEAGYSLLTGTTIWLSTEPWDTDAVGLAAGPDDASQDPEVYTDLIHPMASAHTIKLFDSHVVELDEFSRNTPFQQGALTIPPEYFRGPMGPALAGLLDERWRQKYDPDPPPDDERPPSATWDGRWYIYIACWWRVVGQTVEDAGPIDPGPPSGEAS
ncbi:hypothetical protein Dcar01_02400 [Deinococcus carri]|uniref:Uncharacterized protein n=1 Tax=Deinococcus carri TaxID=1211323 RepID=A0ABP9W948_9DEIO